MKFAKNKTNRGFNLLQFYDDNNQLCDIQQSSSMEPHIWLGTHDTNPKILKKGKGWIDYKIPENVLISNRIHLNRKQSITLAFKLLKYGLIGKLK